MLAHHIALGLWSITFVQHYNRLWRRKRQFELLRQSAKIAQMRFDNLNRSRLFEFDGDTFSMAVFHRHAIGLRADGEIRQLHAFARERPKYFSRLDFNFLFFTADKW